MGSAASKPSRKLAGVVSKEAVLQKQKLVQEGYVSEKVVKGTSGRNEELKSKSSASDELKTAPQSVDGTFSSGAFHRNMGGFDAKKLNQKLKGKKHQPDIGTKDGYDPDLGPDNTFASAVMKLGSHIKSENLEHQINRNFTGVQQLINRKKLHEIGERENDTNSAPPVKGKTMIHARNLKNVLNDLQDERVTTERVKLDYNLHENFLQGVDWWRFKAANVILLEKEQPKEGEIMIQNTAPSSDASSLSHEPTATHEYDEHGHLKEISEDRLKKLKQRLE